MRRMFATEGNNRSTAKKKVWVSGYWLEGAGIEPCDAGWVLAREDDPITTGGDGHDVLCLVRCSHGRALHNFHALVEHEQVFFVRQDEHLVVQSDKLYRGLEAARGEVCLWLHHVRVDTMAYVHWQVQAQPLPLTSCMLVRLLPRAAHRCCPWEINAWQHANDNT